MAMVLATKHWTLDELHSLPDDGNKYEIIHGGLFVTPAPTDPHETIAARLTRLIDPYVAANDLGYVYRPRAVFRVIHGPKDVSEVEPDLMVRKPNPDPKKDWARAPLPSLVVEIASPSTRRRDREHKRVFYTESGIPDYWIIDPDERAVIIFRPNSPIESASDTLVWHPAGVGEPLTIALTDLFD